MNLQNVLPLCTLLAIACQPLPEDPSALSADELQAMIAPCTGADCPSDQDEKRGSDTAGALAATTAEAETAAKASAKAKAEERARARLKALKCGAGCKKAGPPVITVEEEHSRCVSGTNTSSAAGWSKACRAQAPAGVDCANPGGAAADKQAWALCDSVVKVKAVQACVKDGCTCAELGFPDEAVCTVPLGEAGTTSR